MSDDTGWLYPIAILEDRYSGAYTPSGGGWIAVAGYDGRIHVLDAGPFAGDDEAMAFWDEHRSAWWIADGIDPNAALAKLNAQYFTHRNGMTPEQAAAGLGLS